MGCNCSKDTRTLQENRQPRQHASVEQEKPDRVPQGRSEDSASSVEDAGGVLAKPVSVEAANGLASEAVASEQKAAPAPVVVQVQTGTALSDVVRVVPFTTVEDPNYKGAALPEDEEARLQALCGLGILDSNKLNTKFEDISKLLCQQFHVPVAIVTLVDSEQQWFRGGQGLPPGTPRSTSFCAWTFLPRHPTMLVIPDALQDVRFVDNPLVKGEPFIRFYAGAPLVTSTGHRLGSLCIIDKKPRELEAESCNVLINFAEVVVRQIENDNMRVMQVARKKSQASGLLRAFEAFTEGIMICSASTSDLCILFFNDAWSKMIGAEGSRSGSSVWDLFKLKDKQEVLLQSDRAIEERKAFSVDVERTAADGESHRFTASFRPATGGRLDQHTPLVAIPGGMACDGDDGIADDLYFCTLVERQPSADGEDLLQMRSEPNLMPEHPFDDVELGPLLGQGSFGKVYRGLWHGMQIAVKIIRSQTQTSPFRVESSPDMTNHTVNGVDRADLECTLTERLRHPNIVTTHKTARVTYMPEGSKAPAYETWMVLEYCDEGTLQYAIDRGKFDAGFVESGKRDKQPSLPAIRQTALEIASALEYLHGEGILHGDLTPGNILLKKSSTEDRGFTAKVADFGLSRNLEADEIKTQTHGTVTHMPPELLTAGQLSKAADSYAFGTLLWELLTGERPWDRMQPMQVIYHVTIMHKSLTFPNNTASGFKALGEACLNPDPAKRPNFAEIVQTLKQL